jgi:hypothetical protein
MTWFKHIAKVDEKYMWVEGKKFMIFKCNLIIVSYSQ